MNNADPFTCEGCGSLFQFSYGVESIDGLRSCLIGKPFMRNAKCWHPAGTIIILDEVEVCQT